MKLRKPRITPEQKTNAISDYNAGFKVDEILKRNKIARNTFYSILHKEL